MSGLELKNPTLRWFDERLPIISFMHHETVAYPTPKNFNYFWNFGALALFVLVVMILTGVFLVMNYTPHASLAFDSVERIMRDVNHGWLIRYLHMNGASMFFIIVYVHMFRGLYYGSYKSPREVLWILGVVILLIMMGTAFMGYVLPWGQMSFWGATVITNLFSALPIIGEPVVTWLWGGFSVGNPTLNRFFSLHYLLPFVLFAVVFLHLWALHTVKSNNPTGVDPKTEGDTVPFHPYYTIKDLFGVGVFLMFYCFFVFFFPDFYGEPDNYIQANPLATPPHIVPEWYFLPFYAILRAFTDDFIVYRVVSLGGVLMSAKLAGVLAMFASIIVLCLLPWLDRSPVRSARYRPMYKLFFWLFLIDCLVLGYIGSQAAEGTKILIGQISTTYYFVHFFVIVPLLGKFETPRPLPESISAAVLEDGGAAPQGVA